MQVQGGEVHLRGLVFALGDDCVVSCSGDLGEDLVEIFGADREGEDLLGAVFFE